MAPKQEPKVRDRNIYEPLQTGQIRLLRLLPSDGGFASCELFTVSLSNPGHYLAFSYVWGNPATHWAVLLNGRRPAVSHNVLEAVLAFRKLYHGQAKEILFWIDALCINQASIVEKTEQIPLMNQIFGRAYGELIWLSDLPDIAYIACEALVYIAVLIAQESASRQTVSTQDVGPMNPRYDQSSRQVTSSRLQITQIEADELWQRAGLQPRNIDATYELAKIMNEGSSETSTADFSSYRRRWIEKLESRHFEQDLVLLDHPF